MNPTERLLEQQLELVKVLRAQTATQQKFLDDMAAQRNLRSQRFVLTIDKNNVFTYRSQVDLTLSLPVNLDLFKNILVEAQLKDTISFPNVAIVLINDGKYGFSVIEEEFESITSTIPILDASIAAENLPAPPQTSGLTYVCRRLTRQFTGKFSLSRFCVFGVGEDGIDAGTNAGYADGNPVEFTITCWT